eukprot:PhM_4_TR12669/c0_g1_i1/m.28101
MFCVRRPILRYYFLSSHHQIRRHQFLRDVLALAHVLREVHEVPRNVLRDLRVLGVRRVALDEPADVRRRRRQLARGLATHKLNVIADLLELLLVGLRRGLLLGLHLVDKARDVVRHALEGAARGAVDDVVDKQRFTARVVAVLDVDAELESALSDSVAAVGLRHVHLHDGEGDVEVQVVLEDRARHEHHEHGEGGVLESREGDLHDAELDAPADVAAGRRGLEAHRLPVRRLDVLEVVGHRIVVDGLELAIVHRQGLADEQVRDVPRETLVDAGVHDAVQPALVDLHVAVVVLAQVDALANVGGDGVVARFDDARDLLVDAVVHGARDRHPAHVVVREDALLHRRRGGQCQHHGAHDGELVVEVASLLHVAQLHRHLKTAAAHAEGHAVHVHARVVVGVAVVRHRIVARAHALDVLIVLREEVLREVLHRRWPR